VIQLDLGDLDPAAGDLPRVILKLEQLQCAGSFRPVARSRNLLAPGRAARPAWVGRLRR